MPTLNFGVIGDTRPSSSCSSVSSCGYPTSAITALYTDLKGYSPAVQFIVDTGDYQYNQPGTGTASWQVGQYLAAAQVFTATGRPVYPTMGNHECTGYTSSECGPNGTDGITENYTAFLSDLLAPLGLPNATPYYVVNVAIAGGLTAKFVMVTPNAWDSVQQTWLTNALAQPTTYTFIVQHEANNLDLSGASSPASALQAIRSVVSSSGTPASGETYPVTLFMVGHTHNYDYDAANQQMILGLGGVSTSPQESGEVSSTFFAGSTSGAYAVCAQQATGSPPAIQCQLIDGSTNMPAGQSFAVNANGSPATVQ